jgi:hypothetical protein
MMVPHCIRAQSAGLISAQKTTWIISRKRLASCQRNRPETVALPGTPEQEALCGGGADQRIADAGLTTVIYRDGKRIRH